MRRSARLFTVKVSLVLALLLGLGLLGTLPQTYAQTSATDYYKSMGELFVSLQAPPQAAGSTNSPPTGTAKDQFVKARDTYQNALTKAAGLMPPQDQATPHQNYLSAIKAEVAAYEALIGSTPANAPASDAFKYQFATPAAGYAFADENEAVCVIWEAARSQGVTIKLDKACTATDQAPDQLAAQKTVGTEQAPVNDVTITMDSVPDAQGVAHPNVIYPIKSITTSAAQPVTIQLDNRNPVPFTYNLSIYRGYNADLKVRLNPADQITTTTAVVGPHLHSVSLKLAPGIYTYTDNVHPIAERGKLIVVATGAPGSTVAMPSTGMGGSAQTDSQGWLTPLVLLSLLTIGAGSWLLLRRYSKRI